MTQFREPVSVAIDGGTAAVVGPPPPYDPECAAALVAVNEVLPSGITPEDIPVVRGFMDDLTPTDEVLSRNGAYSVEDRVIPGPAGAPDITILVCMPVDATGPVPTMYHIHGGGMLSGNRRSLLDSFLDLAEPLGVGVVSVEYRLAPEHPDPAPIEDCYAGLVWTHEHAAELGIDADRIIVAGASAGGGLAAGIVLLARDRGGPALFGQLLAYPMLDDRNNTVSSFQMRGRGVWDHDGNQTGWNALLGDRVGGQDVSPYAAPARAVNLAGLPPAFLDAGSAETFRDEIVSYASAIWRDGGVAELHVWPGGFHGHDTVIPQAALSQAAINAKHDWLRRLLAT
ncbi:alpha/beta hydrolase [Nocardia sp. 348MFTsu5.1]|uniref:alpha/beta hydrolase n=1 Tax=Nocardia sp. 348MFTsu5.1 TaxID=1172185 RepID=UPI0003A6D11E|nr:alpha/beta hydrolase [Nocardia sp. 348MFTsu5.1]